MMKQLSGFLFVLFFCCLAAAAAERVVSLSPNLTEMIALLGAADQLVGRSSACDCPEAIRKLPVVGRLGTPALEPLLATRPTLVVVEAFPNAAYAERLRTLGLRVEEFPAARFDDFFRNLAQLGALLGREREAAAEVARAKRRIAQWRAANVKLPEAARPKVLVLIGVSPVVTAGKHSFLTSMIELAGGRNVADGVEKTYFHASFEQIVLWQPELILAPELTPEQLQTLQKSPGWELLPAVKNGRVVTSFDADLLYRLGPRIFDGIEQLRRILEPLKVEPPAQSPPPDKASQNQPAR